MPKKSGFTLIELLVVIAILAVLSVMGFAVYSGTQGKARDARRKADVDSIVKAFEAKYDPVKGVYTQITSDSFAGGKVPTPPEGGSYDWKYITASATTYKGIRICTKLQSSLNQSVLPCGSNSDICYCKDLAQGESVDNPTYALSVGLPASLTNPDGTLAQSSGGVGVSPSPTVGSGVSPSPSGSVGGGTTACIGCSADINGDGNVDSADYSLFQACYGKTTSDPGCLYVDLNGDNKIDSADYNIFSTYYNKPLQKPLACENFGDMNKDNKLTMSDVRTISTTYQTLATDTTKRYIADVNWDNTTIFGTVDINDATHLYKYLNGELSTLASCSSAKSPACNGMGDVSTDGKVTAIDNTEVIRMSVGGYNSIYTALPYTSTQQTRANVADPASTNVSPTDGQAIFRYVTGLYTSFQSCPKPPPCTGGPNNIPGGAGDVDGDGQITDTDRNMLDLYISNPGANPLTASQKLRGDLYRDGSGSPYVPNLNLIDPGYIRDYLRGYNNITTFPACSP